MHKTKLEDALYSIGASEKILKNLAVNSAYICVGYPGLGKGNGLEAYDLNFAELTFKVKK